MYLIQIVVSIFSINDAYVNLYKKKCIPLVVMAQLVHSVIFASASLCVTFQRAYDEESQCELM